MLHCVWYSRNVTIGDCPRIKAMGETYASSVPFEHEPIRAAAVYCSDGRFADQVDDFLHAGLGLQRCDRVVCPGGPVCLAGRLAGHWESCGVEEQLRLLVEVHKLTKIILIAHSDCAYYLHRLSLPAERVEAEQEEDLQKALSTVERMAPGLTVCRYFARLEGGRVIFEAV